MTIGEYHQKPFPHSFNFLTLMFVSSRRLCAIQPLSPGLQLQCHLWLLSQGMVSRWTCNQQSISNVSVPPLPYLSLQAEQILQFDGFVFNLLSNQGNETKNVSEILYLSEWLGSKTLVTGHAGKCIEQRKHFSIVDGSSNLYSHIGMSHIGCLLPQGTDLSQNLTLSFVGICSENVPSYHGDTCSSMFIGTLFLIAR